MKPPTVSTIAGLCVAAVLLAACDRGQAPGANGVIQTKYPGQVSAGGLSSGQFMAQSARPETDATYAGGTPGIAGGSGGNTSGAETGGAVRETGQGPSSGVTQPAGAGRPGSDLPSGNNIPAAATPGSVEAPAASNAAPQRPATPNSAGGTR